MLSPETLRWVLGLSFIGMAIWVLIPDKLDEDEIRVARFGVFGTTLITFFLAEGDKTQVATVVMAAQYSSFVPVVAGTTLGMVVANIPAVLLGERVVKRLSIRLVHGIAAAIFAVMGIAISAGFGI